MVASIANMHKTLEGSEDLLFLKDVFTKGMDSSMYHICYNGKWQAWQGLYVPNPLTRKGLVADNEWQWGSPYIRGRYTLSTQEQHL